MPYLVRKLNKRDSLNIIGQPCEVEKIVADAATTEFRTKKGTLSTWRIECLTDLDEAVLAIVVTSTKIETMDFIIINTDYLDEQDLEYKQTYAGLDIAVPDLQESHDDIVDITIPKLINCTKVYKMILEVDNDQEIYIVRYVEGDIKKLLSKAYSDSRIELEKLNKGIKKIILPA